MVKRISFSKALPMLILAVISYTGWGQACPSYVTIESKPGNTICEGESIEFTAKTTGGTNLSYQWKLNGTPLETEKTITVQDLKDGDLIKVEVTSSDSPSCRRTSNDTEITVLPNETGVAKIQASNNNICQGETVRFTITSLSHRSGGTGYEWQLTRNGSTTKISSGNSLAGDDFQAGDKIQLFVDPDAPCVSPFSSNIIEIKEEGGPPPTPAGISGDTSVCPGSFVTYSVPSIPEATEYIWDLPSGWNGSSRSNEILVTAGNGEGTIKVRATNACGESAEKTLTVSSRAATPQEPDRITGATEMCPGISGTYEVPEVAGATEYVWTLPSGWGGSSNTNSISVIPDSDGGIIQVQAKNDCGTSPVATLAIAVQAGIPVTPTTISGPAEVCPGSTQIYSVPEVSGASEYTWSLPADWTGTSTSNSITVTAPETGSGEITVEAGNNCGTSEIQKIEVSVDPGATADPAISGNTVVCPEETATYSVDPSYASYHWTVPSGWEIIQNNNHEIRVRTGNQGDDGMLMLTAQSTCGGTIEAAISVTTINKEPAAPEKISGPADVCFTQDTISYSVPPVDGATGYTWRFPTGWKILSGENTSSVTVETSDADGQIAVSAENGCGSGEEKVMWVHLNSAAPRQPGEIISDLPESLNLCQVSGYFTLSVPPVDNALEYQWILPEGWKIISGAGTEQIVVESARSGSADGSAKIEVLAVNGCGSSPVRVLENTCEDPGPEKFPKSLYVIYVSGNRELIIRNRGLMNIETIYLNNLLGQQIDVYSDIRTQEEIRLPVKQFTPGVYLFRIHSERGILTKQVMLE